ncbi:DUF6907 domain-containing protein [Streptomyces formicae]
MTTVSEASTATPTPTEQCISIHLTVETMIDADDGGLVLTTATESNLADLQEATPVQALARINAARAALDQQEALALDFEAATTPRTTETPHTWSFIDSDTGKLHAVTCMPGCNASHLGDVDTPNAPVDITCRAYDRSDMTGLPVYCNADEGEPDPLPFLATVIQVDHFDEDPKLRVPHAVIEVTQDHFTDPLDPDEYQAFIDQLEQRVAAMRLRHAELVRIRAEHQCRTEAQA